MRAVLQLVAKGAATLSSAMTEISARSVQNGGRLAGKPSAAPQHTLQPVQV
jgi:hypothetical protein